MELARPTTLALVVALAACGDDPAMTAATGQQLLDDCAGTFDVSEVAVPATFRVDGSRLVMRGDFVDETSQTLFTLLDQNPAIRTLVLAFVGGADVSEEGNLTAGREIRRRGLGTCVPEGGLVASGGTDFLLGGEQRAVLANARVGVHSWAGDDGNGMEIQANQIPRDSAEHAPFLSYYRDVGISEDFYWFTLDAAAPDDMYYMSRAELAAFSVYTIE